MRGDGARSKSTELVKHVINRRSPKSIVIHLPADGVSTVVVVDGGVEVGEDVVTLGVVVVLTEGVDKEPSVACRY